MHGFREKHFYRFSPVFSSEHVDCLLVGVESSKVLMMIRAVAIYEPYN